MTEGLTFIEFLVENLGAFAALIFVVTLIPFAGMVMMFKLLNDERGRKADHEGMATSINGLKESVQGMQLALNLTLGALQQILWMAPRTKKSPIDDMFGEAGDPK